MFSGYELKVGQVVAEASRCKAVWDQDSPFIHLVKLGIRLVKYKSFKSMDHNNNMSKK